MGKLSPDDRPREKLARHGAAALGDNELVAAMLGSGCRRTDALAHRQRAAGRARRRARAGAIDLRRSGARRRHRPREIGAGARRGGTGPPDAGACAQRARPAAHPARGGRLSAAAVRFAAGGAVRPGAARHQASRPAGDGAGGRQPERDRRAAARGVSRGRARRRRVRRHVSQPPVGRPEPEPRRCGVDAAAGGGRHRHGHRGGRSHHSRRRAVLELQGEWGSCDAAAVARADAVDQTHSPLGETVTISDRGQLGTINRSAVESSASQLSVSRCPDFSISTVFLESRATCCSARCSTPACRSRN